MPTGPPSRAQIGYLKGLGYTGKRPRTKGQATAAIDEMLRSGDSELAEKAIRKERRLEGYEEELQSESSEDEEDAADDAQDQTGAGIGCGLSIIAIVVSIVLVMGCTAGCCCAIPAMRKG